MVDKKRSIRLPILVIILIELIGGLIASIICCGCASQTPREDSVHYVAQSQDYPCPYCGYRIGVNNINKNIRMENKCSHCGKIFFYTPSADSVELDKRGNYSHSQGIRYGWSYCVYPQYDREVDYFGGGNYERKEGEYIESESWSWWQGSREKSGRAVITRQTKSYHYP